MPLANDPLTHTIQLRLGDSFKVIPDINVAGAVCTDPPYLISFMGKKWDQVAEGESQAWHLGWLKLCFALLPPGGIIKVFSATRTFHRLAAAMEEAGFTGLDLEAWAYGSGFPKYLNVAKAIGEDTPEAAPFEGFATALKPAWEPFIVGVKGDVGVLDILTASGTHIPAPVAFQEPFAPFSNLELRSQLNDYIAAGPIVPLRDIPRIKGGGAYLLLPRESRPTRYAPALFGPLVERNRRDPGSGVAYVGKAIPPGGRKGQGDGADGAYISQRVRNHIVTLDQTGLRPEDWDFRWVVCGDGMDPVLVENWLVQKYQPVLNVCLEGLGNNDPGNGRRNQARSPFDTVFPGRPWADKLPPVSHQRRQMLVAKVRQFLASPLAAIISDA